MAKTAGQTEPPAGAATPEAAQKNGGMPLKKLLMFGVPVFLVQLVVVYFVITRFSPPAPAGQAREARTESGAAHQDAGGEASEQSIYIVKDVIVNPAGTNGTRFLLTTIGFEVTTPEAKKELEGKDVQVRDALNTILTSKDLAALVSAESREPLRQEISQKVGELLKNGSLSNVYFSKFIIQ